MATGGSSANINKFEATMVVTSSLINDDVTATIMIVAVAAATGHLQYSSSHSHGSLVLCALTSDLTSADQVITERMGNNLFIFPPLSEVRGRWPHG
jgi:hypothetical protein